MDYIDYTLCAYGERAYLQEYQGKAAVSRLLHLLFLVLILFQAMDSEDGRSRRATKVPYGRVQENWYSRLS